MPWSSAWLCWMYTREPDRKGSWIGSFLFRSKPHVRLSSKMREVRKLVIGSLDLSSQKSGRGLVTLSDGVIEDGGVGLVIHTLRFHPGYWTVTWTGSHCCLCHDWNILWKIIQTTFWIWVWHCELIQMVWRVSGLSSQELCWESLRHGEPRSSKILV